MIPLLAVDPVAAAAAGGAVVVGVICLCVLVAAAVWQTSRSICLCTYVYGIYIYIFSISNSICDIWFWVGIRLFDDWFVSTASAAHEEKAWSEFIVQFMIVCLFCVCMCVCVCMGRDKSRDVERTRISRKRKREKNIQKNKLMDFYSFYKCFSGRERVVRWVWVGIGWVVVVGIDRERGWERRASAADADAERAA